MLSVRNHLMVMMMMMVSMTQFGDGSVRPGHLKKVISDKRHIEEEFGEILSMSKSSKISMKELAFYFFSYHDFDANKLLDGNEIMVGLGHMHHRTEDGPEIGKEELVDQILAFDENNDGLMNYSEYSNYVFSEPDDDYDEVNIFSEIGE
ncbi:Uncharacterised protein g7401 [Pycnogonum litorale]